MPAARCASAGIAAATVALSATSACLVIAPMTSVSPSRETPASPLMFFKSTIAEGAASRAFIVGSSVMPPARIFESGSRVSAAAAALTSAGCR